MQTTEVVKIGDVFTKFPEGHAIVAMEVEMPDTFAETVSARCACGEVFCAGDYSRGLDGSTAVVRLMEKVQAHMAQVTA